VNDYIETYGVAEAAAREPYVGQAIHRLGIDYERTRPVGVGLFPPEFAVALAVMYPVIRFVLVRIGLPWLYEAARYSELWRLQVDQWITQQYVFREVDPLEGARASKLLREELERTTDVSARQQWERVRETLLKNIASANAPADAPGIETE
jgi:hypothetical protein